MNFPKYILLFRKIMELKNYSENTISNYTFQVERFLKDAKEFTEPAKINEKFIIDYLLQFKSHNTNKHAHNNIKTTQIYTHVSNNVIQNSYSPI